MPHLQDGGYRGASLMGTCGEEVHGAHRIELGTLSHPVPCRLVHCDLVLYPSDASSLPQPGGGCCCLPKTPLPFPSPGHYVPCFLLAQPQGKSHFTQGQVRGPLQSLAEQHSWLGPMSGVLGLSLTCSGPSFPIASWVNHELRSLVPGLVPKVPAQGSEKATPQ